MSTNISYATIERVSPEEIEAGVRRGRELHAEAVRDLARATLRAARTVLARLAGRTRQTASAPY